jgi:hypothetical protein
MKLLSFLTALLLSFPNLQAAPQATVPASSSSAQATTLLRQSAAALVGRVTLTDVTLSGTARRIAGSDDESGTAVLKVLAAGASRVDLSFPSGHRSEILNTSVAPVAGSWSGPDGVSHGIAFHNLFTGSAWFFPAFTVSQGLSASGYVATYVASETHNGQAVQHVSLSQPSLLPTVPGAISSAHLTRVDLFLDSTTLLPAAIAFNIHADNNQLLDIPIEIRFSSYQAVNGVQVPFHVQKYLNNGLILDFQATSVTLNSGLSASAFSAQ